MSDIARAALRAVASGRRKGGGYVGALAATREFLGWFASQGSADADTIPSLPALRARSRDLYRNAPLARGAVITRVANVLGGTGLALQPTPDRELLGLTEERAIEWVSLVKREFALWGNSKDCDLARSQTFGQLQSLAFLSVCLSGDVFVALPYRERPSRPYSLCIQLIEADRIQNPPLESDSDRLAGGVELDRDGAPLYYHILDHHPGGFDWRFERPRRVRVFGPGGRRNILHYFEPERPGQRRGVPFLAPVIKPFKQLDRYADAELMAAVVSAFYTVFITSQGEDMVSPVSDAQKVSADEKHIEMGSGAVVGLAPGEQVQIANPGRPNAAFDPFVMAILKQMGAALGCGFELLVKHFSASYSASRASLLQAWKYFLMSRADLETDLCQPVYEEWLHEAVALGRVPAPGFFEDAAVRAAWSAATWTGPAQGQIDEVKAVEAATRRVAQGFSTRQEETAALTGGDFARNAQIARHESDLMSQAGLAGAQAPAGSQSEAPADEPSEPEPDDIDDEDEDEDDETEGAQE